MTIPSSPVTAASLRAELVQKLRQRHIAADTGAAADVCLSVVLPHLRGMAAEIERLRDELAAVRAHALLGGIRLADLERIRDAARTGKIGSEGERDG